MDNEIRTTTTSIIPFDTYYRSNQAIAINCCLKGHEFAVGPDRGIQGFELTLDNIPVSSTWSMSIDGRLFLVERGSQSQSS